MNRAAKRHQQKLARKTAKNRPGHPPQALGQGSHGAPANRLAELVQNALRMHQTGQIKEAAAIYRRVLHIDPDHADANHLLGVLLAQEGKRDQAVDFMTRAIAKTPDRAVYHSNLGAVLQKLERLEEAVDSHRKALALEPDFADAHYNLGSALSPLGRIEEAVASFHKALTLKPDYTEAHNNMGNMLSSLGRVEEAAASYHKALATTPDYAEAWNNLKIAAKALNYSEAQGGRRNDSYKDGLDQAARASGNFALLEYHLDRFRPHESDESHRTAIAALPPKAAAAVTGNGIDPASASAPYLSDKLVALLHFGRSGSGFLHGLIDGHPEISTLPSIYLRGFFNAGVWETLAVDGWRGLAERFTEEFEVLFDAASPKPTPARLGDSIRYMGKKEGMTTLGENRDEALSLDRDIFCAEAVESMKHREKIDPDLFLRIVHAAYEKTIGTETKKHTIFYHIHNPDDFAKLNFLRHVPDARLIMIVREPIQSCESWIRTGFEKNDYSIISHRITGMLFAIDQIAFRTQESVGIRLEDLKRHSKATLRALCAWLGVEEAPSLYETTAQGKKWWGDPSSPDYDKNKNISAFDDAPIRRAVGTVFSDKDQFVLRTLFYPFSVRFGYRESDPEGFKRDLKEIRPLLEGLLDFERVISERLGIDPAQFQRGAAYLALHASFLDRWNVLDEIGDYPGMLTPLDIHE